MKLDIDQVIYEAPMHKTMASLARKFNAEISMFKYRLMKAHKLMLVKNIIRMNKGNSYEVEVLR